MQVEKHSSPLKSVADSGELPAPSLRQPWKRLQKEKEKKVSSLSSFRTVVLGTDPEAALRLHTIQEKLLAANHAPPSAILKLRVTQISTQTENILPKGYREPSAEGKWEPCFLNPFCASCCCTDNIRDTQFPVISGNPCEWRYCLEQSSPVNATFFSFQLGIRDGQCWAFLVTPKDSENEVSKKENGSLWIGFAFPSDYILIES